MATVDRPNGRRSSHRAAEAPVPFPYSGRLLAEGAISHMSLFAIQGQEAFAGYLTAVDRGSDWRRHTHQRAGRCCRWLKRDG